jgi:hypothetical protein
MPSMSYCAFENAVEELNQLIDLLSVANTMEEFLEERSSEHERRAVYAVRDLVAELHEIFEDLDR